MKKYKRLFPWFGGKSLVTSDVWARLGDVDCYIEPFAGSLAVLFGRITKPKLEIVNDKDCLLVNFWRAVKHDPAEVYEIAKHIRSEADIMAREIYLIERKEYIARKIMGDADFFDAKVAGFWGYVICAFLGGRAVSGHSGCWWKDENRLARKKMPGEPGVKKGIPAFSSRGILTQNFFLDDILEISERLKNVCILCRDWEQVINNLPHSQNNSFGIFLDPPYSADVDRDLIIYAEEDLKVAHKVREWCIKNGDNPKYRIALCGYEGEHEMPDTWEKFQWVGPRGYAKTSQGVFNRSRERIWFSPHCLKPYCLFPTTESLAAAPS